MNPIIYGLYRYASESGMERHSVALENPLYSLNAQKLEGQLARLESELTEEQTQRLEDYLTKRIDLDEAYRVAMFRCGLLMGLSLSEGKELLYWGAK